ncbi:hypothetical protein SADUNF_Sadunf11G0016600 [Salix dunnii]|uniref:Uncharacterized protein n=1 Tax=Salix dunnii TaxID=1413687 RepID=A0A835JML8_9ROSI|nr:hypothetical protein SADUNF_Sadunf11G0016600 [Salix dunnii]
MSLADSLALAAAAAGGSGCKKNLSFNGRTNKNSLNKRTRSQTSSNKTQHAPTASFRLTGHLLLGFNSKTRTCQSHSSGVARHIQQPV